MGKNLTESELFDLMTLSAYSMLKKIQSGEIPATKVNVEQVITLTDMSLNVGEPFVKYLASEDSTVVRLDN